MKIFLSHAAARQDTLLAEAVRKSLSELGEDAWIDARELTAGDDSDSKIRAALERADAFLLFVSAQAFQDDSVLRDLDMARQIQSAQEPKKLRMVPLLIDGTQLGAFKPSFSGSPRPLPLSSGPGGVEEALPKIREALGLDLPTVTEPPAPVPALPVEELIFELSFPGFDGERPQANATLTYSPADPLKRDTQSRPFRFVAPIGAIELEELRWYLEDYARWPGGEFVEERVKQIEQGLADWGKALYNAAIFTDSVREVLSAWKQSPPDAVRRFSIQVNHDLLDGATAEQQALALEAGTRLLGLPWELLHDGTSFLFQGRYPVRVRRRLPNYEAFQPLQLSLPIRILLVCSRPEDASCSYLDHRLSAKPLVQAMEKLPGLVELTILEPATFPALLDTLQRASDAQKPYHVVHFDGHGIYSRKLGLGGLCFESPQDAHKLSGRAHQTIYTESANPNTPSLKEGLRGYQIPLIFLDACQGAQGDDASGSVASALLQTGTASVVAMTHSVLVSTAARFVEAFYKALAEGSRVGDAMLAGQRYLAQDSFREDTFTGPLHLQDWFVPVLYQEEYDPQLFTRTIPSRALEEEAKRRKERLGALPAPPPTQFIGRSKELLALERLLFKERWAVILGEGGEGKTTLAAELARWLLRSRRVDRAAFVCVEGFEASPVEAVLDSLGKQLLQDSYSTATFDSLEKALLQIERILRENRTLLVLDNLESLLIPPYLKADEALKADARDSLNRVLALCQRLVSVGDTRIVFTSREELPEPFADRYLRLTRLVKQDAVEFVERTLQNAEVSVSTDSPSKLDREAKAEIEELVDAVQGHARTLSLLAPSLKSMGVNKTRQMLAPLMQQMEQEFPGAREKSLFASVALSLQRLSPDNQQRVKALAPFHGGADLDLLRAMMGWEVEDKEEVSLARELLATGLATLGEYNYLHLNPALCPYLRAGTDAAELQALTTRWQEAMQAYVGFLAQQQSQNTQIAASLTLLELPGLVALLERVEAQGDPDATIDLATSLHDLVRGLGKPRVMARIAAARDKAEKALGSETWSHAAFAAQSTRIEQQLQAGQLPEAFTGATRLLERARQAGEQAYELADYDLAMAHAVLGRILKNGGRPQEGLPYLTEAERRFEAVERRAPDRGAANMASVCLLEQADCLRDLGRLDQAATLYETALERAKQRGATRSVAVGSGQLGTVRYLQGRFGEALSAYQEALQTFTKLGEDGSVATVWHQLGMVHQRAGNAPAAEEAYVKSLDIETRSGNLAGQATTLNQIGLLYDGTDRREGAIPFFRQAVKKYNTLHDSAKEGMVQNNLADTLRLLGLYSEAREEAYKALECKRSFGLAAQPWTTWDILHQIELAAGNAPAAAEARQQALALFLDYRQQGGENHSGVGQVCQVVAASLLGYSTPENQVPPPDQLPPWLQQILASDSSWDPLIPVLLRIVGGERDRALAETPGLRYDEAAEIHMLLEALEAAGG